MSVCFVKWPSGLIIIIEMKHCELKEKEKGVDGQPIKSPLHTEDKQTDRQTDSGNAGGPQQKSILAMGVAVNVGAHPICIYIYI